MTRIPSISGLSCSSTVHLNSPPRSTPKICFSLPTITVSSSTTSNLLLLETNNSCRSLCLLPPLVESPSIAGDGTNGAENSNDDINEDPLFFGAVISKRSPSVTTSAADHSPLTVLEIGSSFEEAVRLSESPKAADVKRRETPLKVIFDKFGKNLSSRMSGGCFSRSPHKLIEELEELALIIKGLEVPAPRLSSPEIPSVVPTNGLLVQKFLILEKEEVCGSVSGLGIRLAGVVEEEGIHEGEESIPHDAARSFSEPISNLRRRFHDVLGSLQKYTPEPAQLFSPRLPDCPPPSPANWLPTSSTFDHITFTRSRQNSLPLEHIFIKEKNKSVPVSPTGSLFAGSAEFVRRSFDIITPRPHLASVHRSPQTHVISQPPTIFAAVKFSSLKDIVRGQ